ncbi:hypothetical protein HYW87_00165 [Candidatus Roizmanbacteria bacterium]|nr:hypothetical protein [Candidatus Roizmanbacteria bacterium]
MKFTGVRIGLLIILTLIFSYAFAFFFMQDPQCSNLSSRFPSLHLECPSNQTYIAPGIILPGTCPSLVPPPSVILPFWLIWAFLPHLSYRCGIIENFLTTHLIELFLLYIPGLILSFLTLSLFIKIFKKSQQNK